MYSFLIVFLDSLLSQRMTKRETGMTEWVLSPHHRHPTNLCHPRPLTIVTSFEEKAQSGGPFLADCISGFPAFAENDGMGNGNDGMGCLPCTIVTLAGPFLFFVFQEWLGREAQEVLSGSTM